MLVPPLGQTVDIMTLTAWYKKEGEAVAQGEMLFALETDKSTLDVEAPAAGVLSQVLAQPGDAVTALSVIAIIRPVNADAAPPARRFISPRARRLAEAQRVPLDALVATGPEGAIVERDVQNYLAQQPAARSITPVARRMAEAANLDWHNLPGSMPPGRLTRADIAGVLAAQSPEAGPSVLSPAETADAVEVMPLSRTRAVIAERMLASAATTAQVTLTAEAEATRLVELRQQLHQSGIPVSYNDLFIFLLARALRDHPQLNASLDAAQNSVKIWRQIHIGLAVDTDRGLLTPVLRDVAGKGLGELAAASQTLITCARAGQCSPDELRGSTFTLTNLGMYGIDAFTPLLNLPECAILGVGRIKTQPVMLGEAVVGRPMVWLSLTFDHRLVDGGPAARFLQRVVQLVEQPVLLLA